jgi:hypothetical protein
MLPRTGKVGSRFVLRFRTLAKAKRCWEVLAIINALKVLPDDVWINYNAARPREITLGTGDPPEPE